MSCRYKQSGLEHCWYLRNALQYLVVPKHARSTLPSSVCHPPFDAPGGILPRW